jgi:K+ transporter
MVERLKHQPGIGPVVNLVEAWPRVTAWIVLSVGCIILLVYEARDVGLTTGNWIALIVATIAVAGLCIWIVSWEDEEEAEETKRKNDWGVSSEGDEEAEESKLKNGQTPES